MTTGMITRSAARVRTWTGNRDSRTPPPDPAAAAQRQQLIDQARATDIVQLVGRYTQLRRKATGEYEGPCPRCGGSDRFTVDAHGWFCRTCKPYDAQHGWYGAIDFVMWITGLDFKGAVGWLTGAQMSNAVATRPAAPPAPERTEPDEHWRADAELANSPRGY